ncbi:MAG: DNA translocase FtsK 4TM domain-containing protein, partial [Bryobacteraceae bacterium]
LDPSWNTAAGSPAVHNLTGRVGAHIADFCLQVIGLAAFAVPVLFVVLAWKWLRSAEIDAPVAKICGSVLLVSSICTLFALAGDWRPFGHVVPASGIAGGVLADYLISRFNRIGSALLTGTCLILSLYLATAFSMASLPVWFVGPLAFLDRQRERFSRWRAERVLRARETARLRAQKRAQRREEQELDSAKPRRRRPSSAEPPVVEDPFAAAAQRAPWEELEDIPIHELEPEPAVPQMAEPSPPLPAPQASTAGKHPGAAAATAPKKHAVYEAPSTSLLQEAPARNPYDSQELKEIAASIKSKFEEFSVHGSVTQINPGPVVTTFEFKPEAGVKYSRITTLSEDLCLGLQADSILIERIPGKPTVGIEVPNTKREVIGLRQILESEEFRGSGSPLTISLGKDINGRIKVATLDTMPHLLIAGSTGSGKSVMLNSLIMSILYKATPEQVRMILVDPKRLEMGLYEGIPHLLTPVITDAKKATNALRNAVLEMERRLKLLAAQGVRNIEQYNRKVRQLMNQPRSLFDDDDVPEEEPLEPLPYILVLIDELADLMMNTAEHTESMLVRLAQMARATGIHLVVATQRQITDVVTGLIKANFPARISFAVASSI